MRHTTVLAVLSMIFMLVDDIFPFIEREKNRGNWRFKDSYQQSAGAILPSDVVEAISVPR